MQTSLQAMSRVAELAALTLLDSPTVRKVQLNRLTRDASKTSSTKTLSIARWNYSLQKLRKSNRRQPKARNLNKSSRHSRVSLRKRSQTIDLMNLAGQASPSLDCLSRTLRCSRYTRVSRKVFPSATA